MRYVAISAHQVDAIREEIAELLSLMSQREGRDLRAPAATSR